MEQTLEMIGEATKDLLVKHYFTFQRLLGVVAFAALAVALSKTNGYNGVGALYYGFGIFAFIILGLLLLFSSFRNPFNSANKNGVILTATAIFFFTGLVVGVAEYAIVGSFFLFVGVLYFLEPICTANHPDIIEHNAGMIGDKVGLLQKEAWKKEFWTRDRKGR